MPNRTLPANKTKLVCTIGPASDSPDMLEKMIEAGMDIARINFSHGNFQAHRDVIARIRSASETVGKPVVILADLPGPKIRIGSIVPESVELIIGNRFTLTTEEVEGTSERVSVTFKQIPRVVKPDDILFLNDGQIQLRVEAIEGVEVYCRVLVGGNLRSKKGLNLPGIDLGVSAFTEHDRACMQFALDNGVDAISQSFVVTPTDFVQSERQRCNWDTHPLLSPRSSGPRFRSS